MDPLLPKKDRMIEYDAKTRPLLTIFSNIGKLVNFEVKKGVNDYPAVK